VLVTPERVSLGVKEFAIDGARWRHERPHLDILGRGPGNFEIVDETRVRRIIDDAGSRVGLLDFRPERKGPFGRFVVTSWAESK
jgi:hypothetical protein